MELVETCMEADSSHMISHLKKINYLFKVLQLCLKSTSCGIRFRLQRNMHDKKRKLFIRLLLNINPQKILLTGSVSIREDIILSLAKWVGIPILG